MAVDGRMARDAACGGDVRLTLDIVVQHHLEEALDEILLEWGVDDCCGIVLDPHTGEILAWANRPHRNPNQPYQPGGDNDHVGRGYYEVGSVFKPFTVAWALEQGVVQSNEILDMPPIFRFPGVREPITDTHFVGPGTIVLLLSQSSNVGAS